MSRDTVLARGRARVEDSFTETVTVGDLTRSANAQHQTVETITNTQFDGKATVTFDSDAPAERDAAGRVVTSQSPLLKVPVTATLLSIDAVVLVTASDVDASLVGRKFTIAGSPDSSQVVCHRYPLKEYR